MENLNYKIERASFRIDQSLQDLPVGIAYLILENKTRQIKQLYYQQVKIQMQKIQQQQEDSLEEIKESENNE